MRDRGESSGSSCGETGCHEVRVPSDLTLRLNWVPSLALQYSVLRTLCTGPYVICSDIYVRMLDRKVAIRHCLPAQCLGDHLYLGVGTYGSAKKPSDDVLVAEGS